MRLEKGHPILAFRWYDCQNAMVGANQGAYETELSGYISVPLINLREAGSMDPENIRARVLLAEAIAVFNRKLRFSR